MHGVRLRAKFRFDRFILSPSGGEKLQFFPVFWTSAFSNVANWQHSEKVARGAQLQAFPYGIKIVSELQRLHGEMGRTISDVHKGDGEV